MSRIKKLIVFSRATLITTLLLQSALSTADDTEIFLSRGKSDIKPNVLFILDDSESMKWCLSEDWLQPNPITKENRCPDGTFKNRFSELTETLNKLLPKIKNVRFGMLWMNHRNGVGLPIDDIEKVRSTALDIINNRPPNQFDILKTPIDRSLYDAARYFNGFPAGKYPGNPSFPGHSAKEAFGLKNDIPSPITAACQPNHIVLLTDGDAWYDDIYDTTMTLINRKEPCAEQLGASSENAERCVPELAEWLHSQDQMPDSLAGKQTITIDTIGLALNSIQDSNPDKLKKRRQFLMNIASAGGGRYYEAEDSEKLLKSFNEILEKSSDVNHAYFLNPNGAPGNSQNSIDQIYYALFEPTSSERWNGNLKRYRLGTIEETQKDGKKVKTTNILDVNNKKAQDNKGQFLSQSQSFWSDYPDGDNISKGGAAWQLPDPQARKLFVEIDGKLSALNTKNRAITKELLKAKDEVQRQVLLNYIQGYADDGRSARSKTLGDILHSTPVLFSYGDNENNQVIIVGTNEGFVHLFNRETGVEEFAFMPGELLKNIKHLKNNEASNKNNPHTYGVDNTVTIWLEENQNKSPKHVYAYITLRRGGKSIYALDITDRKKPKLLWKKTQKNQGFARLGQTWSQPVKSKVNIAGDIKDVLIFGGGYDPTEDDFNKPGDAYRSDEAQGNGIYMVEAKTGELLWSASRRGSNLNLPMMVYSIVAKVSVVDINQDGLADQLLVGDLGGQVWRLFIHNGQAGNRLVTASGFMGYGPFAQLGRNTPENARRFYHEAQVEREKSAGKNRLMINIGSGYHAHPLNKNINDRFYSLRADLLTNENTYRPLYESDLHPVTRSFDSSYDEAKVIETIDRKQGWYLPLSAAPGEKMLSTAWLNDRYVEFNTYVPTTSNAIGCQVTLGKNFTYRLSIRSGAPPAQYIGKTTRTDTASKVLHQALYRENNVPGILNSASHLRANGRLYRINGAFAEEEGSSCSNPKGCKLYWIDLK